MRKLLRIALLLIIIVGAIYLLFFRTGEEYLAVKEKELERFVHADALAYRNEVPLIAPLDGVFTPLFTDGERVPAQTIVATIAGTPIKNPIAGTVSWYYDGLESVVGPGVLMGLKQDYLKDWDKQVKKSSSGDSFYKGEIIGRIVDNYAWFLLVFSDMPAKKGEKVAVTINKTTYNATVSEVLPNNRLALVLNSYQKEVAIYRVLRNIKIVKEPLRGIIIPSKALIEAEEGFYVEIMYKNQRKNQPVRLVGRWQNQVVVDGLPSGAKVILAENR
jgi:hypothetical protein